MVRVVLISCGASARLAVRRLDKGTFVRLIELAMLIALVLYTTAAGLSATVLLEDDFPSSFQPLATAQWKTLFGACYQSAGRATHAKNGVNGSLDGGFKSVSTFGGRNNGTLTADFLGVKSSALSTSNDNWWGLWDSAQPWNPTGVMFRTKASSQLVQVVVGNTPDIHDTKISLAPGSLYDFRIIWTPGVEVSFFGRKAGAEWEILYSTKRNVPDRPVPVQVRDESLGLDFDRITVDSTPIVEPKSVKIAIDLSSKSHRISRAGFLHGFIEATESQIRALSPAYWRSFAHTNYTLLKRLGIETSAEFTYTENGRAIPINATNKDTYISFVKDKHKAITAAADAIGYKVKYLEFWNEGEGDYLWNPLVKGETVDKFEREYYAFKVFYDTVREVKPDAQMVAPSSSHFWPELMEDFIRRCSLDNVKLDAVSWHAIDVQAPEVPAHVEFIRNLLKKYPNVGAKEIHINEWGWPNIGTGSQMSFFYYLDKSNVDIASKSIWGYEPLDNLFVKTGDKWQPRVSYWAWKFYGQLGSTGYSSRTDYPFTLALAANDKANPSVIRLIVARATAIRQYCSDPVPTPKVPPFGAPLDIFVKLGFLRCKKADISITSLPAGDSAMLTDPVQDSRYTTKFAKDISRGELELSFPQVKDEESFLVTITPRRH
ncbi:MAG: hypothetical protein WCL39_05895 [Armatimonadota bacterium]